MQFKRDLGVYVNHFPVLVVLMCLFHLNGTLQKTNPSLERTIVPSLSLSFWRSATVTSDGTSLANHVKLCVMLRVNGGKNRTHGGSSAEAGISREFSSRITCNKR